MMPAPFNQAGVQSYEAVPCTIDAPQQQLQPHSTALTGNMQHIVHVPNVPSAAPVMIPSAPVPQWSAAITVPQKTPSLLMPKTKGLAILLIVASIVQFILGIGMLFTLVHFSLYSGVPFWGAVSYLVAAGLTMAAQDKAAICLMKASLALNIFGAIISCLGVIMACLDIVISATGCPLAHDVFDRNCQGLKTGGIVVYSFLLITNLLLFCVSVSIAVYGCQALQPAPGAPQVYLVQNVVTPPSVIPATALVYTQAPPPCAAPVEGSS